MIKGQPNRLDAEARNLAGTQIDRTTPLSFVLDGRKVHGFAGDTVLSALLASGVNSAGSRQGSPLALTEHFAPLIAPAALATDEAQFLPMQRTPALAGEEYVTVGPHSGGLMGLLARSRNPSLGHNYDRPRHSPPWLDAAASLTLDVDIAIVGGGVAGLSAALAAGQAGSTVVLIERRQDVGGNARLFGSMEDEEAPDAMLARLVSGLARLANVTILTRAEAMAVGEHGVRVHQVEAGSDGISARVISVSAQKVVLATGSAERLPVFSGNRLPGVIGLAEAFDRADRFGIWPGRRVAFNTVTSPAYRLAMLGLDAGITVSKMSDTRLRPQSRFVEFSKAYGMPLSSGLVPRRVAPYRHGGLEIGLALEMENYARPEEPVIADQFVVGGGWQPDLMLWIAAGGEARWKNGELVAAGTVAGILVAGATAGYRSLSGCAQSGAAAVAALLGRSPVPVFDLDIDPMYESPDGATPMHAADPEDKAPAYLDSGADLSERLAENHGGRLPWQRTRRVLGLAELAHPLSPGALAANIGLGLVPEHEAAAVSHERCLAPTLLPVHGPREKADFPTLPPPWLAGRFGANGSLWRLEAAEAGHVEAGKLLYLNTDTADPRGAVGVVLTTGANGQPGAVALVGEGEAGKRLVLRDVSRQISVRLIERLET